MAIISRVLRPGPAHFLVAEDDPQVARFLRRWLERHGWGAVTVAATAHEASAAVAAAQKLTGVILDVALPDGTGFDVAARVRERFATVPILLVSGTVDAQRLQRAYRVGALYLGKPVDAADIKLYVERAIAREHRAPALLEHWTARHHLTPAESITLRYAIEGMRADEIAQARDVGRGTVKGQIHTMLAKIGASSLADAVARFFRELAQSG